MAITHFRCGNRTVSRWALDPIARPFGRLIDESGLFESAARWMPAVNVEETGDELVLTADLPGFTEDTIEIALENGVLTIRGETEERTEPRDGRFHLYERRVARFQRVFTLPCTVSPDAITATLENGVLHVHMPKAPGSRGCTIPVRKAS